MHVLAVEGVLQKPDDVLPDGILSRETLRPGQELARIERRLFDREGEREAEGHIGAVGICVVEPTISGLPSGERWRNRTAW